VPFPTAQKWRQALPNAKYTLPYLIAIGNHKGVSKTNTRRAIIAGPKIMVGAMIAASIGAYRQQDNCRYPADCSAILRKKWRE